MKQDKQDRRSQRTRRLVTTAMMDLLAEQRYDAITVQDVLDRAGIGRSTFYAHFYDKEDVLAAVIDQHLELFRERSSQRDVGQTIVPSLELFRHAYEHAGMFRPLLRGHVGELLWETVQTHLVRDIEQALADLAGEQGSASARAVPLNIIAQYLAGALWSLFKWWIAADVPYAPDQMDQIFQELALSGVLATLRSAPFSTGHRMPAASS